MTYTALQLQSALNVCPSTIQRLRKAGKIKEAGAMLSAKGRPARSFVVVCPKLAERIKGHAQA